jgi:hypothetical protein
MGTVNRAALDTLVAGIASGDLLMMLTEWRTNPAASFSAFPGLAFGGHPAVLSGNPADDACAISAGTGEKLPVGGSSGGVNPREYFAVVERHQRL